MLFDPQSYNDPSYCIPSSRRCSEDNLTHVSGVLDSWLGPRTPGPNGQSASIVTPATQIERPSSSNSNIGTPRAHIPVQGSSSIPIKTPHSPMLHSPYQPQHPLTIHHLEETPCLGNTAQCDGAFREGVLESPILPSPPIDLAARRRTAACEAAALQRAAAARRRASNALRTSARLRRERNLGTSQTRPGDAPPQLPPVEISPAEVCPVQVLSKESSSPILTTGASGSHWGGQESTERPTAVLEPFPGVSCPQPASPCFANSTQRRGLGSVIPSALRAVRTVQRRAAVRLQAHSSNRDLTTSADCGMKPPPLPGSAQGSQPSQLSGKPFVGNNPQSPTTPYVSVTEAPRIRRNSLFRRQSKASPAAVSAAAGVGIDFAPAAPLRTVLVSAVAMISPSGAVLLAQRPEGKPMAGLWEFPGGKV